MTITSVRAALALSLLAATAVHATEPAAPAASAPAPAPAVTPYGAQLEGFSYPYPIQKFRFSSQQQALEMAYMDVPPKGAPNGRTAVLLHGKNFCGATWEATIDVLATAGWRVVVPDQIGFCASTKPRGYQFSFGQLAANTQALLQSLGLKQVTLIGHSMGGMLSMRLAVQYPQSIERMVLVNPIGLEDWQAAGVPYASIDDLYKGELKTDYASIKAYQMRYYFHGNWKPEYDKWVQMQAGLYAGPGKEIVAWNQAQTSEMLFTQPVVHDLGLIRAKTTLIIGGKDRTAPGAARAGAELQARLGNYPALGQRAARAIPGSTLIELPERGHSPQVEAPQEFHEALMNALKT